MVEPPEISEYDACSNPLGVRFEEEAGLFLRGYTTSKPLISQVAGPFLTGLGGLKPALHSYVNHSNKIALIQYIFIGELSLKPQIPHACESGYPLFSAADWIPACAGMTGSESPA